MSTKNETTKNETRREKFVRVAPGRVAKAVRALDTVARLGSDAYEYSPDEAESILAVLQQSVDAVRVRLAASTLFELDG